MSTNEEYIQFKLAKANEALRAAVLLHENKFSADAVSKIYYAAFYAVSALLAAKKLKPKTHSGVRNLFTKEYILTGIFDKHFIEVYNVLLAKRFEVDYEEFAFIDEEKIPGYIEEVKKFIEDVERMIRT